MRHRVYGRHLNRDKNQRKALFRGLVRNLVIHESIETTSPKAQAIKGLVDRLISKSKLNTNASRRVIESFLPYPLVSKKLIEEVAPRYKDRQSGFTQIIKLGIRSGDGAMMVRMNLVSDVVSKEKPAQKEASTQEKEISQEDKQPKKRVTKSSSKKEA